MTKKYAVSVIILNYNAEKFLRETLKSVQMQKKITVETIVVDNNSTDGSKSMVKKEFKDVRWVQRDTSLGFSAGNNAGLPFVHSDVVLFLNPDGTEIPKSRRVGEVISPEKMLSILGKLEQPYVVPAQPSDH